MNIRKIEELLKSFEWELLKRFYGSAHDAIIGFIATEWTRLANHNSVLNGVPKRKGRHADILLCEEGLPIIVAEIQTGDINQWKSKLDSLSIYLNEESEDYSGIKFGVLLIANFTSAPETFKACCDSIKKEVEKRDDSVALIAVDKRDISLDDSPLSNIRMHSSEDSTHYKRSIVEVSYWLHKKGSRQSRSDTLWKRSG